MKPNPPAPFTEEQWLAICDCICLADMMGEKSALYRSTNCTEIAYQAIDSVVGHDYIQSLMDKRANLSE